MYLVRDCKTVKQMIENIRSAGITLGIAEAVALKSEIKSLEYRGGGAKELMKHKSILLDYCQRIHDASNSLSLSDVEFLLIFLKSMPVQFKDEVSQTYKKIDQGVKVNFETIFAEFLK